MKIKTFEQACKALKISSKLPTIKGMDKKMTESLIAEYKLSVITKALNDGWKPNYKDTNQPKYYIWWDLSSGGFSPDVFYRSYYFGSSLPLRLLYKDYETAKYSAIQFKRIWKQYILK